MTMLVGKIHDVYQYGNEYDEVFVIYDTVNKTIRQSTHGQWTQKFARGFGKIYKVFDTNQSWMIVYETRANDSACGWQTYWVTSETVKKDGGNIIDLISKHFLSRLHDWEREIEEYNNINKVDNND